VLSLRLALNGERFPPAERRALLGRLEDRLTRLPGVAAAGFVSTAPLAAERPTEPFTLEPVPAARRESLAAEWRVVTPGFFRALGLRRVAGRLLGPADRDPRRPVTVIDSTFARRAWAGGDPLGKRLRWPTGGRDLTVVGVVGGVRDIDLEAGPRPVMFLPYEQVPWRAMALVLRPTLRPAAGPRHAAELAALAADVRRQIAALAPGLPVSRVRWLEVARRQEVAGPRLGTWLLALFAAAALGLAVSGVYATTAAAVAQGTPEIALRQALGAARGDVWRLVLGRGVTLTLLGLALGIAGALLFSQLLAGLLYEIPATRAATYAAGALLLAAVAMLASVVPARRATRVSPVLALRRE
jgi:putative ABC transport system permease protein